MKEEGHAKEGDKSDDYAQDRDELEVQRRDICAQYASQARQ